MFIFSPSFLKASFGSILILKITLESIVFVSLTLSIGYYPLVLKCFYIELEFLSYENLRC